MTKPTMVPIRPSSTSVLAMWRTRPIRWASLSRKAPTSADLVCPSRPAMARRTSVERASAPIGQRSSALSSRDEHQHLLAGPDHAHDEEGEDQLADVRVVGRQDAVDPALHPHRAQEDQAGAVDQQEAEQEQEAVAADRVGLPMRAAERQCDLAPGIACAARLCIVRSSRTCAPCRGVPTSVKPSVAGSVGHPRGAEGPGTAKLQIWHVARRTLPARDRLTGYLPWIEEDFNPNESYWARLG